ncbi:MAG: chitobiase/beta-hexosaminidase C-terminal domain-containing protein, partial [Firmicutes bacterium]|nr:chitobiase/beta-hexosaminidase C-terminal domain-containing protein [Bacillota bacterium]
MKINQAVRRKVMTIIVMVICLSLVAPAPFAIATETAGGGGGGGGGSVGFTVNATVGDTAITVNGTVGSEYNGFLVSVTLSTIGNGGGPFKIEQVPVQNGSFTWVIPADTLQGAGTYEVVAALVGPNPLKGQTSFSVGQSAAPTADPPAGTYTGARQVTLAADAGAKIYYTTDGSTPTTGSTLYTAGTAIPLSVGSTVVKAIAVKYGAVSAVAEFGYVIQAAGGDTTPPVILTAAHNAGSGWLKAGASFKVTVLSEKGAVARFKVGNGSWNTMTESAFIKGRYEGIYTVDQNSPQGANIPVVVQLTDQAGNATSLSDPKANLPAVKIDSIPPAPPVLTPGTVDKANKQLTLTITAEAGATVELYRWSNKNRQYVLLETITDNTSGTVVKTVPVREGANRFGAKAIDPAGNAGGIGYVDFTLDTQGPVFDIYADTAGNTVTITVYASEALSGVPDCSYIFASSVTGSTYGQGTVALTLQDPTLRKYTGTFTKPAEGGKLDITVKGTDTSGNQGTSIYTELVAMNDIGLDADFNDVHMIVPPDAFFESGGQQISVSDSSEGAQDAANQDLDVLQARHFRPDGTRFRDTNGNPVYVAITFNYDKSIDADKLLIFYYDPVTQNFEQWSQKSVVNWTYKPDGFTPVPKTLYINPGLGRITIFTDHFSVYGVAVDNIP